MKDYPNMLVAFLDDFNDGHEFERWPHHVTILPWFKADGQALESIKSLVTERLPLKVQIGQTAMFGARSDILVSLIESDELQALHQALLHERNGILGLVNSNFVGEKYIPHTTLQGRDDPEPGSRTIEKVALVRYIGPGKLKKIIENYD